ncbi:hypothetical protein BV378_04300 [Nostoc sp. RF31YmG]|jgi:hypothetical protein|nr:hypothetical protein BV378_04300 [Nostoc sp. RF31YmG]
MDNILIEHTNHEIYFSLAKENLVNAQTLYREIISSGRVIPMDNDKYLLRDANPETSSWLNSKLLLLKKYVLTSIIFSALTAEAFINYYAISKGMSIKEIKHRYKPEKYEHEEMCGHEIKKQYQLPYEERTSVKKWTVVNNGGTQMSETVTKWIEIPFQFKEKYIASGLKGRRIYELNELFRLRNKLVHHKAKVLKLEFNKTDLQSLEDNNYVSKIEAEGAIDVVEHVVKALQQIDNDIDLNWLNP